MVWTEAAEDTVKRLWRHKSATHISGVLWAEHRLSVSRSAVCGKAHRLGLSNKQAWRVPKKSDHRIGKKHNPTHRRNQDIPVGQRRTLMELTAYTCRWPVGTVGEPDFFFCGAEKPFEHSYCAHHEARSWRRHHAQD